MIKIAPGFEHKIARAGFSKMSLAKAAGVGTATVYGITDPAQQPGRRGGVHLKTAWKIARAYAQATGIADEAAFDQLFVNEEYVSPDGRHITQTAM